MKQWLAVFIIICLLPLYAFAMDVIDDTEMDNVTGATGIDLFLAGTLEIQISGHQLKYGDTDGLYGTGNGAYLVLDSPHDPPQDSTLSLTLHDAKFSIDIGTKDRVFDSPHADVIPFGTSFIRIELPKFTASVTFNDFQLQLEDQNQANANTMCIIQLTDLTLAIEEIYSPMYIFTH
ncbi:conserved hypothetical protein, secreted [Candidatus Magnetomorum sp. HK-1]|nr:conserved hypothetical protein, secreted [Candidatus Magnetomorum sp. HK-1]